MLRKSIFAAILAAASLAPSGVSAQAQNPLSDPLTQAMMEVYAEEIAANPQAYDVYFRRANEYYKFNQYLRALSDIENAIKFCPAADTDMLYQCQLLRGDIYQMLGKHRDALPAYEEALRLDPTSFMALYQKGNCEFELGDYSAARNSYTRLQAANPRSAEALTGLARVAVKENNLGQASQLMDDAVKMLPSDSDIFVRRASVRRMLGNNTGAVDDLIMAITIDSNPKAFQQLVNISNEDYPAVITALSNAVSQAPDQGMFYYIRAVVAQAHNHFPQAITDYQRIIDENMYNYAGIYASLGECYFALCDFQNALDNVNQAIGMTAQNAEYYIPLARILRAQGRFDDALSAIDNTLSRLPGNIDALAEKGRILFSLKQYDDAQALFGELIMDNANDPMYYMLRAWVLTEGLDKTGLALPLYQRVQECDILYDKPSSLYGFTLLFTDHKAEALKWAEAIVHDNKDTDGSVNYLAACFFAQAGEADKALDCLETALSRGYSNRYHLTLYSDARINVAPIRTNPRFEKILNSYSYIFQP